MAIYHDPDFAGFNNEGVVHLKQFNGGTPRSGDAGNYLTILFPPKMVFPHLLARIEKLDGSLRFRIDCK